MSSQPVRALCFIADPCESQALFSLLPFTALYPPRIFRYHTPQLTLDLCLLHAWGSSAVHHAIQDYPQALTSYDLWLNLGFAGACSPAIPLSTCYLIEHLGKLHPHDQSLSEAPQLIFTPKATALQTTSLVTADAPYILGFHKTFQLVDMEGYAIATLAHSQGLPLSIIKITSDYTLPRRKTFVQEHSAALASVLAKTLLFSLPEILESATIPRKQDRLLDSTPDSV